MATSIVGCTSFITIGLFTNYHSDKKKLNPDTPTYQIVFIWPYARDILKAGRNAYRGVHSLFTLIDILELKDLHEFIIPVSVALGILSAANRVWYRASSSQREMMLQENKMLLQQINSTVLLQDADIDRMLNMVKNQSQKTRKQLLFSSIVSGVIDGLNPYIGTLGIGCLTPASAIIITAFCTLYFTFTLTNKIYVELHTQYKLDRLHDDILKALSQKQTPQSCSSKMYSSSVISVGALNFLAAYKFIMLSFSTVKFLSPIKINSIKPTERSLIGLTTLVGSLVYTLASFYLLNSAGKNSTLKKASQSQNPNLFFKNENNHDERQVSNSPQLPCVESSF